MIRTKPLPPDATIADVLPGLEDGAAYLRAVLATMRVCQKHYGDAWVRISVSSKAAGRKAPPSYRIDRPEPGADKDAEMGAEAGRALFGAYGGRAHERFTQVNTLETRWSVRALGMAEMLALSDALRRSGPRAGDAAPGRDAAAGELR